MKNVMTASAESSDNIRGLSEAELDRVSGGFKWDHNHVSNDVIDARGGSVTGLLGFTITYDVNGNISSVTRT